MVELPKPKRMGLKIGSMKYLEYIDSLLGDDGRLARMEPMIAVPPTPDNLTPRVFQRKIIEMRKVREELEQIRGQLKSARMVPDRKQRWLAEEIKLLTSHLRTHDPDVRAGRNVKEQDAMVEEKLRDKFEEQSMYNLTLKDIDHALDMLKFRVADVKNAQQQLSALEKIWADERKDAYHYRFTADENPLPQPGGPDPDEVLDTRKKPDLDALDDFGEEEEDLDSVNDITEDEEEEDLDSVNDITEDEEEEDLDSVDDITEDEEVEEVDNDDEDEEEGPEDEKGTPSTVSEDLSSDEDEDLDFDLDEDEDQMMELLPSEFSDDEVDNFLESEENPDFSSNSMEDQLDDLLEDFDIDDD